MKTQNTELKNKTLARAQMKLGSWQIEAKQQLK